MNYGDTLKLLRNNLYLKQSDIASVLNISRSTYKDYELQIKIIPIYHLITLADYYNISVDYILNLTDIENYTNIKKIDNFILSAIRIKEFRKEFKITQEKLALFLNTTHSLISNLENSKSVISTPFLYAICKKYNISADYLLGRVDEPKYLDNKSQT